MGRGTDRRGTELRNEELRLVWLPDIWSDEVWEKAYKDCKLIKSSAEVAEPQV